jgi:hypothetical protein
LLRVGAGWCSTSTDDDAEACSGSTASTRALLFGGAIDVPPELKPRVAFGVGPTAPVRASLCVATIDVSPGA